MPASAWAAAVLQAFNVRTREELDVFLRKAGADRRIFEQAQKCGWVLHIAPYPERGHHVYSPGALRRWTLSLPVYRCDKREDKDYDALGLRLKVGDAQDQDPARDSFLRQQLLEYFNPASPGARPAPMASAAIVMADDGLGVWWPARLGTPAENEWFRKTYKIRTKGVCVNLICYDGNSGLNTYDVVKQCRRITRAELKEMYELSQAEHSAHPDSACSTVTGTRHTHRQTFKRRQRQEEFRAALAFAMALDCIVPETRRYVPLTAPCANDATVPQFTTPQLENPLNTPQVATDPALAFALDSLRYGLKKIQLYEEWEAAQQQAEGEEGQEEGTEGSGSDGGKEGGAAAATLAAAMMMSAPFTASASAADAAAAAASDDRRVKPRTDAGPGLHQHHQSTNTTTSTAPRVVHALLLPDAAAGSHNLDEILHAPGGGAHGDARRASASSSGGGANDDDGDSHATAPVPSDDMPPSLDDDDGFGGLGAGSSGGTSGSASSSGGSSAGGANALSPAAQLVVAFERLLGLVGMHDQGGRAKLDRFRSAAFALARAGGGGGGGGSVNFVAAMTEATAAFNDLWVAASDRLGQKHAQPQAGMQAAGEGIRARLEASGLGGRAAEVLAAGSVEPLRQRLVRLLGQHKWAEQDLELKGRELRQAQASAAQSVAWFESTLRGAPVGTTAEFRAAATQNVAKFRKRVHDVQAIINAHDEVMRLRRAIVDVRPLVASLQHRGPRAAALNENHEARIFEMWGNLMIAASARQHTHGGTAASVV